MLQTCKHLLQPFQQVVKDVSRLFFPHDCAGCGTGLTSRQEILCYACQQELPFTNYFILRDNPVERSFYGRIHVELAAAAYFFTKDSLLQYLLFELKYRNNQAAGLYLGRLMGYHLRNAPCFDSVDALIPLPLHPKKLSIRGYNQAALICRGIASVWPRPVIEDAIERKVFSETQTHQNRIDRWQNMEGIFSLVSDHRIQQKHLLLVDDVTTTGATLESAGSILLKVSGTKLSIATVAWTI